MTKKQNLVLIGMPASGKSTIGKRLEAKGLGTLVDTDKLIVEKAGMPITEIFAQFGEKHFRDIESEVIMETAKKEGLIISTGGGAILREENVAALKETGTLIFLNRSLSFLRPTGDRPLSDDEDKMKKLFEFRMPIYAKCADIIVTCDGSKDETTNLVLMELNK